MQAGKAYNGSGQYVQLQKPYQSASSFLLIPGRFPKSVSV
jgi:hypothetical protein